jgi:hypothetical protein
VDLARTPLTLGTALNLDPATEEFSGESAAAARRLVRATHRKPFTLPELS